MAKSDGVLFEGFNKNLIVYSYKEMENQHFRYLEVLKKWENIATGNVLDLESTLAANATVVTSEKNDMSMSQKWDIHYCDEEHDDHSYEDDKEFGSHAHEGDQSGSEEGEHHEEEGEHHDEHEAD